MVLVFGNTGGIADMLFISVGTFILGIRWGILWAAHPVE
jgi:hypothetical protein